MVEFFDVFVNFFDSVSGFLSDSISYVADFFSELELLFGGALEFIHYLPPQVSGFALLFLTSGVFLLIVRR